jgi:hypothetical protein
MSPSHIILYAYTIFTSFCFICEENQENLFSAYNNNLISCSYGIGKGKVIPALN